MAKIEVNHQRLRDAATEIKNYCTIQDTQMKFADGEVKSMLTTDWTGDDAIAFGGTWEGVDDADSTAVRFRSSLDEFAKALEKCAAEYETAQSNAYNKANWLPKILR